MRRSHRRALTQIDSLGWLAVLLGFSLLVGRPVVADEIAPRRLGPLQIEVDAASLRVVGHDPLAPRDVILWSHQAEATEPIQRLATTRSFEDGRFEFPALPMLHQGTALQATAAGQSPEPLLWIPIDRPLPAPSIQRTQGFGLDAEVLVQLARYAGELRVYDDETDRLLMRMPLDVPPRRMLVLDLNEIGAGELPDALRFEQIDERGRRSPATRIETTRP